MHGRRREVRRDGDHFGAVVVRFPEKMRIGNAGDGRVAGPDQAALRFEDRRHIVAGQRHANGHVGADRQIADAGKGLRRFSAGNIGKAEQRGKRGPLQHHLRAHGC